MDRKIVAAVGGAMLAASVVASASAATSPWTGTWKLNEAKSRLGGETFAYALNPNGSLRYTNGSTLDVTFACDGNDYTAMTDRTVACSKTSDAIYDLTFKDGGKPLSSTHIVVSPDGQSIDMTTTGTRPDGTTFDDSDSAVRVSGTSGIAGKWRSVKTSTKVADVIVIDVTGDAMTIGSPGYAIAQSAKLDGTETPVTGPTVAVGYTASYTRSGPLGIDESEKLDGKPWAQGTWTLGDDGKTLTETYWTPGKPDEKTTYVYDKQ